MAKKSMLTEVVDATKSVAGAALGAAARAGTQVVVGSAADAMSKGGQRLGAATPRIQRVAADTVSKPILPSKKKRSAARRKAKATKRKVAVKKGKSTKKRTTRHKKR